MNHYKYFAELNTWISAQPNNEAQSPHLVVPAAHTELGTHAVTGGAVIYAHAVLEGRNKEQIQFSHKCNRKSNLVKWTGKETAINLTIDISPSPSKHQEYESFPSIKNRNNSLLLSHQTIGQSASLVSQGFYEWHYWEEARSQKGIWHLVPTVGCSGYIFLSLGSEFQHCSSESCLSCAHGPLHWLAGSLFQWKNSSHGESGLQRAGWFLR